MNRILSVKAFASVARVVWAGLLPACFMLMIAVSTTAQTAQSNNTAANQTPNTDAAKSVAPAPSSNLNPADVVSVDAIINRIYEGISGAAGKRRDWGRERALYLPGARLIAVGKRRATGEIVNRVMSIDDYINANSEFLEKEGFFEKEVARRTESFGNIVQVWSTYEARRAATDAKPFMRGINSIQLINDGKRWWVMTILWQAENPETPLPEKYLQK